MTTPDGRHRYVSPPNWPTEAGFVPPDGWLPDEAWGPAPEGWVFWEPLAAVGPPPPPGAEPAPHAEILAPTNRARDRSKVVLLAVVVLLIAGGVALAVSLGGGKGKPAADPTPSPSPSPTPDVITLTVPLDVFDNTKDEIGNEYIGHAYTVTGSTCVGRGTYQIFSPGHTVDLLASDGSTIATADIGTGRAYGTTAGEPAHCHFSVDLPNVPADSDLVKIQVGTVPGPTFTNAQVLGQEVGLEYNRASK